MLVDLTLVEGPLDRETAVVGVNPKHVVLAQRAQSAQNPDAQAFVTELTLAVGGVIKVAGSRTDVMKKLNLAGGR